MKNQQNAGGEFIKTSQDKIKGPFLQLFDQSQMPNKITKSFYCDSEKFTNSAAIKYLWPYQS